MVAHGLVREEQAGGDRVVRQALTEQGDHLELARGERRKGGACGVLVVQGGQDVVGDVCAEDDFTAGRDAMVP